MKVLTFQDVLDAIKQTNKKSSEFKNFDYRGGWLDSVAHILKIIEEKQDSIEKQQEKQK